MSPLLATSNQTNGETQFLVKNTKGRQASFTSIAFKESSARTNKLVSFLPFVVFASFVCSVYCFKMYFLCVFYSFSHTTKPSYNNCYFSSRKINECCSIALFILNALVFSFCCLNSFLFCLWTPTLNVVANVSLILFRSGTGNSMNSWMLNYVTEEMWKRKIENCLPNK